MEKKVDPGLLSGSELVEELDQVIAQAQAAPPLVWRSTVVSYLTSMRNAAVTARPEWGEINSALLLDEVEQLRKENKTLSAELADAIADRISLRLEMASMKQALQAAWAVAESIQRAARGKQ